MKQISYIMVLLICSVNAIGHVPNEMILQNIDRSKEKLNQTINFENSVNHSNQNVIYKENQNNGMYVIGDFAHGGIVFYVDESGEHGLVCAKEDQSSAAKWGKRKKTKRNERFSEDMSTTTTIFNEKSVRRDSIGEDHAMQICEKLKVIEGGKTYKDWYLPSKEELNMMYLDAVKIDSTALANGGSPFAKTYYWSATEVDYTSAWVQYFENGNKAQHFKNYRYNVRAVRAF